MKNKKQLLRWSIWAPHLAVVYALLSLISQVLINDLLPSKQASMFNLISFDVMMVVFAVFWLAGIIGSFVCARHMRSNPRIKGWRLLIWKMGWVLWPVASPLYWHYFMQQER